MERDGNTWKEMEGVLPTWSLKSCPKKRFEVLLCRAIQRGQSARAAARHEAMKQRLCSVFHFSCAGFLFCSVSIYFEVVDNFWHTLCVSCVERVYL